MGRLPATAGTSRGPGLLDSLRRNGRYLLLCGAALTLAVISLSPLLANGLNGDDLPNSVTYAASTLHAQGQGLGDIVHSVLAGVPGWAQSGRFFPLSAFEWFLLYFVDGNALALKLVVLLLILVDLCLLGYLTTQITASRTAGVLAILITPLLFQFRTGVYHDPITAFGGLLQVVLTSTLISLVLLLLHLRSGRRRYLVASLAIYAANLLTYEITIPFFLLFAVLAWLYPERRSLLMSARISWPFAAVAGAAVALSIGLRLFYQVAFSGSAADYAQAAAVGGPIARAYIPNLAPSAILATIAHQVSAALPLGFQELAAPGRWTFPSFSADLVAQPMFYLLLIAGYGAMAVVLGLELWHEVLARAHGFRPGLVGLLGLGLLILPNAMISLSPRYQAETSWGIGYLPVYLSCFGMALLLAVLIYGLFRLAGSAERHAVMSMVTTVALGLGIAWVAVVNNTNLGVDFLLLVLMYGLFRVTASAERAVAVALSTVVTFALSIGIAYVSVVNHANNSIAVETGNVSVWYPRVTVAAAVQRGLFAGVPTDATIVIDGSEPAWDVAGVPPFFTGQAGVTVASMVNVATAIETMRASTPSFTSADGASTYVVSPQSDVYYLTYKSVWRDNGYALLGRVRELTVAANGVPSMQLEPVHLFMSAAPLAASTPELLLGPHGQGLATTSPTELGIDPNEMEVVASGSEWSLFGTIPGGTPSWVPLTP